ncbi:Putative ABC transporter substrate-binding protein OS=Tsukamurella paurometabola (strain ATCC 8368/ DSM / CCUG 35730 / CIP 100753 / JCM 10117 / KCTC 9821/ NBRC 16120 / NCIMB 702349 / NCTC 13040) OX=521096 GN=Tpau_1358 PE=4 SV=1 [Tsukamurella paurometabola]|uniref:Putative ABC transporter substrate-binding protein n=1 Tax=Tsukamurella paurometabola (strain ATCC 8368 / DSM 20162 / CCUG 35730 / CIP 100753 / JCM 10117 / KCTC 9821 / NBRC 16120 / NCIMB 702349 / NCTC 13040) TaxID=521096 RepID=D5UWW5_TSUPD|nr:substrate-binding domain-containing protein [Tsukamurella paurometabola]ADG77987.1 putative ABC transporter substrate-binding protein [Tsukamurella paurometabola DSM 20162]SUP29655.1 D-ribose-binding periplasmic protein precursor [Tsukamurella paurometabola]
MLKTTGRFRGLISVTAAGLAVVVAVSGCSSTGGAPRETGDGGGAVGSSGTKRLTIAMVTHQQPGDTFWDLVRKGAEMAARKGNITLRYSNDPQAPNQANLVQSAVDAKVDGIAVTLATPSAMAPAVAAATKAGIPVVALNAGFAEYQGMGIGQYFGQDEVTAGRAVGDKLTREGAKKAICVIHQQGQVQLESRCAGVKSGFSGGTVENLNVNGEDMSDVQSKLTAKLQQDPSIDRIVALGAPFALGAAKARAGTPSKAAIVSFDTNAAMIDAIRSGDVAWAVDQQPYLQGYLAVDSLWLYLTNRNTIGGGQAVSTGPAFIDKGNVDAVAELAKAGTR